MRKSAQSIMLTMTIVFLAVMSTVSAATQSSTTAQAATTIGIGDYVQMGRYYNEPILWRCVDIDENGPLMLSDRILTIKPFDVPGDHIYLDSTPQTDSIDSYKRADNGSNLWETSNLRSWLNSNASAGNVTWLDKCPPTEEYVYNGYNDYASEKGFLANGNFTAKELNSMKVVKQKSILNILDTKSLATDGTESLGLNENISEVLQNYDTSYSHYVTDKMFILDIKQINKVYQNSNTLGSGYYIGKPTQKAVDNSEFKHPNLNTVEYWENWTRSPYAGSYIPVGVRISYPKGNIIYAFADSYSTGVRPAFYINLAATIFKSGSGTADSPYVVAGDSMFDSLRNIINPMTLIVIAALTALLLIIVIVILIFKKKRKKALKPAVLNNNAGPDMWMCSCGNRNIKEDLFCTSCGKNINN